MPGFSSTQSTSENASPASHGYINASQIPMAFDLKMGMSGLQSPPGMNLQGSPMGMLPFN